MEIYSYEVIPLFKSLNKLYEMDLGVGFSYKIAKIKRAVQKDVEDYENEKNAIIQKHTERDEDGNPIPVKDDNGELLRDQVSIKDMQKFYDDMAELGNQKIELPLPVTISIEELESNMETLKTDVMEGLLPLLDGKTN